MKSGSDAFDVSVTTSWVALPTRKAEHVSIRNDTGADILIRKADRTSPDDQLTLPTAASVGMVVLRSSSDIEIKADDAADGVKVVTQWTHE